MPYTPAVGGAARCSYIRVRLSRSLWRSEGTYLPNSTIDPTWGHGFIKRDVGDSVQVIGVMILTHSRITLGLVYHQTISWKITLRSWSLTIMSTTRTTADIRSRDSWPSRQRLRQLQLITVLWILPWWSIFLNDEDMHVHFIFVTWVTKPEQCSASLLELNNEFNRVG